MKKDHPTSALDQYLLPSQSAPELPATAVHGSDITRAGRRQPWFLLVLALVIVSCATTTAPPPTPTPSPSAPVAGAQPTPIPTVPRPGGNLGLLDQLFVQSYERRQSDVASSTSPVITVSGSELFLYRDGKTTRVTVIPDRYHILKAIAHAPFTVYLNLGPLPDGQTIPVETQQRLQDIATRLRDATAALESADVSGEQRTRARELLGATNAFLEKAALTHRSDQAGLQAFARYVGPLLLANAWDAGCTQINQTHQQVMAWKREMAGDEWARLRVVNRGAHQARYKNAASQYFAWLFKDTPSSGPYPGESDRVVYAEAIFGTQTARDVLATVTIDADASRAFFGDAHRMSEDILRDGATACIATLPASDRNW